MELRHCPFCGSPAKMTHHYEWHVICTNENCFLGEEPPLKTQDMAVAVWNKRISDGAKNTEQAN